MNHPLRCRCGTVQGEVLLPATTARAVCYCKDCQAYAHFLRNADTVLDASGGTDIVALPPSHLRFHRGQEAITCMSLSPKGLLRWYTSCCETPIGNTPRNPKVHYVGLVHSCLDAKALDADFGPAKMRLNTKSAHAPVEATGGMAMTKAMLRLSGFMLPARFNGRWRDNPLFTREGLPVRTPHVISEIERRQLDRQVLAPAPARG